MHDYVVDEAPVQNCAIHGLLLRGLGPRTKNKLNNK